MVNADKLSAEVALAFVHEDDKAFWPAVTAYIKAIPVDRSSQHALKHIYYHSRKLIDIAVSKTQLSEKQRHIYSLYFSSLGDELIEDRADLDYLLFASDRNNTDMIKLLYPVYFQLQLRVSEQKKTLIARRLKTVENNHQDLTEYFKIEKDSLEQDIKKSTNTIEPEKKAPISTPPKADISSEREQPSENITPIGKALGLYQKYMKVSPLTLPVNHHNKPIVPVSSKPAEPEDEKIDPLTFHHNTWIGAGVGFLIALAFITTAYTMPDDTCRDGFYRMFMHIHEDFHHEHGDINTHSNVKFSARVGFFALLSFGSACIGGFIGSRFKPTPSH